MTTRPAPTRTPTAYFDVLDTVRTGRLPEDSLGAIHLEHAVLGDRGT